MPELQKVKRDDPKVVAARRRQAQLAAEPMTFSVFDAASGTILRSGSCARCDLAAQSAGPAEIVIEGRHDDSTHGVVVDEAGISVVPL